MKRPGVCVVTALLIWSAVSSADETPKRIVCAIPAVTQMLFAIGAGPQVVAVGNYDREPPEVAKLPRVGGLLDPDTERILALHPDLVVVYESQRELQARLSAAHVRMYRYKHGDLKAVTATIRQLGTLLGRAQTAEEVATGIESRLKAVAARVAGRPRPLTMVVFGREPQALRGIYASGGYGFVHDMITIAGGRNVFEDIRRESVQPTLEDILARRPEAIIELRNAMNPVDDGMEPWKRLSSLPAVTNSKLFALKGDEFVEDGPRVAEAAEQIARTLHPEAWR